MKMNKKMLVTLLTISANSLFAAASDWPFGDKNNPFATAFFQEWGQASREFADVPKVPSPKTGSGVRMVSKPTSIIIMDGKRLVQVGNTTVKEDGEVYVEPLTIKWNNGKQERSGGRIFVFKDGLYREINQGSGKFKAKVNAATLKKSEAAGGTKISAGGSSVKSGGGVKMSSKSSSKSISFGRKKR